MNTGWALVGNLHGVRIFPARTYVPSVRPSIQTFIHTDRQTFIHSCIHTQIRRCWYVHLHFFDLDSQLGWIHPPGLVWRGSRQRNQEPLEEWFSSRGHGWFQRFFRQVLAVESCELVNQSHSSHSLSFIS